jgi:tripartite-type tricarboxylate transporter receptor subunit TctC
LCDEPFSALDEMTGRALRAEFVKLVKENGKTAVFVTHSINEALEIGDRLVVLKRPANIAVDLSLAATTAPAEKERSGTKFRAFLRLDLPLSGMAMRKVFLAYIAALCVLGGGPAQAQDWPTRALTMINPFAPGGPNDVPARLFAQRMGEILGQSVIVENVGGAGGMNGADRVAKAQPDGYTFLLGTVGTQAQNQTLFKKPAYDSTMDFVSVGLFLEAPLVLVVRKDLPVNSMQEFVAYAKANADKMQFASAGTGSAIHLGCALMNSVTGLNIVHVPYRGSNPAMQDLASGRVDYLCDIVTTAKPQIDGGAVKAIAVLNDSRSTALPDVPTAMEQGYDVKAYTWNAFFLPKGTPEAIVGRLNHAMVETMKTQAVRDKLDAVGLKLVSEDRATSAYLDGFVQSEIAKWAVLIKASGISID